MQLRVAIARPCTQARMYVPSEFSEQKTNNTLFSELSDSLRFSITWYCVLSPPRCCCNAASGVGERETIVYRKENPARSRKIGKQTTKKAVITPKKAAITPKPPKKPARNNFIRVLIPLLSRLSTGSSRANFPLNGASTSAKLTDGHQTVAD